MCIATESAVYIWHLHFPSPCAKHCRRYWQANPLSCMRWRIKWYEERAWTDDAWWKSLSAYLFLLDKIWGCRLMECVISCSPPPQTPPMQQLFLILNEPWAVCWNFHTKVLEIYFSTSLAQEASALRNCNSCSIRKGDLAVALGTNPSSTDCCNPLSLLLAMSGWICEGHLCIVVLQSAQPKFQFVIPLTMRFQIFSLQFLEHDIHNGSCHLEWSYWIVIQILYGRLILAAGAQKKEWPFLVKNFRSVIKTISHSSTRENMLVL